MSRPTRAALTLLAAFAFFFFTASAAAQLELRSGFGTYTAPGSVVAADFNGDGIMDLAIGSFVGSSGVQVFLGKSGGEFEPPVAYDPGTGANAIAVADLNHDGIPDIVVVSNTYSAVDVLLGNGDGTFQAPVSYETASGPTSIALADLTGNGNLDIVTTDGGGVPCSCTVNVLLGNGDGTFQEPGVNTALSGGPEAIAAGYFKVGESQDLAVTETFTYSDTIQILLGNGDGTFTLGQSYDSGPSTLSIVGADLRNNGTTDLVAAESGGMGVEVLLGNGDGSFQQPVVYNMNTSLAAAVGDMNGDGIPDIVALGLLDTGSVAIFAGNGDGTFQSPKIFYPSGLFPRALALADLNGDRQLDVAVADQGGDREYVFLNTGVVAYSPDGPANFGSQQPGTTSAAKIVTLTNTGTTALAIRSMKAEGEFGVTSTCGKSVAAAASCTLSITFSPTSAGPKIGAVEIDDSASSKLQVVALSGTGS